MSLGGFLIGVLKAEISASNLKKLANLLVSRLGGKSMEISIDYIKDGKEYKLKVKARDEEDLKNALAQAENFIKEN